MINYSDYENIIFDFDGVVVDSNSIKKKCIYNASKEYCDKEYHEKFVAYFTKNNGIPREIKINNFFDGKEALVVLEDYNNYLKKQLKEVNLTNGFQSFINLLNFYQKKLFVLSGGTQSEVVNILRSKELDKEFIKVMGGPKTKEENLNETNLIGKTLFIGDSLKDYEVANKYGFDFIFMYSYTQFEDWKDFFKDKDILMSIKDFTVLTNCKC